MKKRLEWRIAEKYTAGLPALLLVGPVTHPKLDEEVYVACSFYARDVNSMYDAAEQASKATKAYREKGWTIVDKNLTLNNMLAV